MSLNINTSELIKYTDDLEKYSNRSLKYAVRNTLNSAAFDMKKDSLQSSVNKNFKGLKAPQFFKRFSGVNKASGNDINSMKSIVGFLDTGNQAARKVVENLPKQELGGIINDGAAYLKDARVGSQLNRFVRKKNYYDKNKVINGRSGQARNKGTNKSKFVARAARSFKEKKPIFLNSMKGNFLVEVTSFRRLKSRKIKFRMKFLMKERDRVTIKATNFLSEAKNQTQSKIPTLYQKEVEKQLEYFKSRR